MKPISIVMPTAREAFETLPTVESAMRSLRDDDVFWLVVNADDLAFIKFHASLSYMTGHPCLRIVQETIPGLLCGRHRGLSAASTAIVAFIDDDVILGQHWRRGVDECFASDDVHLVGGPSRPQEDWLPPSWLGHFWVDEGDAGKWCAYLSLLDLGDAPQSIRPELVWGLNFIVRRQSLIDAGGFHPDGLPWDLRKYRGDGETAVSVEFKRRGWKAVYDPRVAVTHVVPKERLTIDYFEKRAYLQGISDSYTSVRASKQIETLISKRLPLLDSARKLKAAGKRLLSNMPPFRQTESSRSPSELARVHKSYSEGYSFHQAEVKKDPRLLEWVLRENYWNYSYPSGTASGS